MRNINADQISKISDVLKVIGHPQRLNILLSLEENPKMSVAEIQEALNIEQSLLSHHLIRLKEFGILKSHKDGRHIYYSLEDPYILNVFDCIENCSMIKD